LHYNPYFPGGAIAMPKMLIDGAVEYEDDTPATEAQVIHNFYFQHHEIIVEVVYDTFTGTATRVVRWGS
jgi:hypothetical protein